MCASVNECVHRPAGDSQCVWGRGGGVLRDTWESAQPDQSREHWLCVRLNPEVQSILSPGRELGGWTPSHKVLGSNPNVHGLPKGSFHKMAATPSCF